MLNIILAVDINGGIGKNGILPWNIKEELNIFKEKTLNSVIIVGRKTLSKLPKLDDRTIICVSKSLSVASKNDIVFCYSDVSESIENAKSLNKKIFIIGGNQIFEYMFKNYNSELKVHISFIKDKHNCDTYFDLKNLKDFYITYKQDFDLFTHYEMVYQKYGERQYLDLIKDILYNGERRIGRNGEVISDFCKHLKFDLQTGFPLLTTKKMFLKGIVEELLFFIRGDTDTKILEAKGINIWKGNTNREFLDTNGFKHRKEGEMGPMYGSIWRNFNGLTNIDEKEKLKNSIKTEIYYKSYNNDNVSYNTDKIKSIDFGIDQLKNVIHEIKTNPTSRRLLMTTYNPGQVRYGVLYPCHSVTIQFHVQDEFLDMFCYNRSSDLFLGLPFNIASSALLLMIISKLTNLTPRYLNLSLGDVHIYSEHEKCVKEQLERIPYLFPKVILPEFTNLEEVEKLTYKDFIIEDYNFYTAIKAEMVA
jgi:thymidylate synthase/dihydrofolate reductase